jgi:hypothetical protein
MAQYSEVEQAIAMPGLRVVLSPGVPGPWSESAKGILHVKKIPYVKVRQILGAENPALRQWTAQETAPAFIYNDERPRSIWSDQLYLAERLAPAPTLIPANLEDRARMFGLANELCGENGFGWARRLMILHEGLSNPNLPEAGRQFSTFLGTSMVTRRSSLRPHRNESPRFSKVSRGNSKLSANGAAGFSSVTDFPPSISIGPASPR